MSSSFQKVKFLDVVQIITERIPVRDAKVSTYISTDNMIGNLGGVTEASQLPKSGSVTTFNENDVLFSNIRTYFRKVWLADHAGSCSPDVLVFRTRSPKVLDQRYLHWIVCSQDFIKYTDLTAKGAKMPRGDKNAIGLYKLKLPELSKQKGIATVLDNIAQKITNNSQINQTLEQIAQALFKSWFVDFDPVKAKIEVLEAGGSEEEALIAAMQVISSKSAEELAVFEVERPEEYAQLRATAALFPAAMVGSELGKVPEGWEVGALADVADLNKNSWTKRNLPVEIEYVDLANTKNGIIELTTPYLSDEAPSRARRKLMDGDTIVGTVRPGNRSFAFIKKPSDILTGSTGFAVLSPKKKIYAEFIYIAATSDEAISRLAHLADGGAYPAVRSDVVSGLVTVIPEEEVLDYFHSLVSPFFELSERFHIESLTLKKLRDTLLPKLLSGEITFTEILLDEGGVNV